MLASIFFSILLGGPIYSNVEYSLDERSIHAGLKCIYYKLCRKLKQILPGESHILQQTESNYKKPIPDDFFKKV